MEIFNALRYIRSLEAVGFRREQAEAQVELVMNAIQDEVATKSDIAALRSDMTELRSELRSDVAELRSELRSDMAELRAEFETKLTSEISSVRADIAAFQVNMAKMEIRIFRNIAALIVPTLGIMTWLARAFH